MMVMKKKLVIIAVLVISFVASYILCGTGQNDVEMCIRDRHSRFAPLLTFAEGDPEAEAEILSTVKQELSSHLQNLQQATEGELSIEAMI